MSNKSRDINGNLYTEAQIKTRLSKAYKEWYAGEGPQICEGCGGRATETSHIIAKAKCKVLHMVQLIWDRRNTFPSCRECHQLFEAYKNPNIWNLQNYEKCLKFIKQYDLEDYERRINAR